MRPTTIIHLLLYFFANMSTQEIIYVAFFTRSAIEPKIAVNQKLTKPTPLPQQQQPRPLPP